MNIKRLVVILLLLIIIPCVINAEQKKSKPNPPYALSRGFANVMFGWLEMPRGIIYENARIPIVGFLTGPVKGIFLTAWREIAGVVDIAAMGLTREGLYFGQVPDFVWDAEWIPECGEDVIEVKNVNTKSCVKKDFNKPRYKAPGQYKHKKYHRKYNYKPDMPPVHHGWKSRKDIDSPPCYRSSQITVLDENPFYLGEDDDDRIAEIERHVSEIERRAAMYR